MPILQLILMLLPSIESLLGTSGAIKPALADLLARLTAAIPALYAALRSGQGATGDVLAVLAAIQTEADALRGSQALSVNEANELAALSEAVADAIAAYQQAQVVTDPSNLTPLPTDL